MIKLRKNTLNSKKVSLYLDIYNNGQRKYELLQIYLGPDKNQNKELMRLAESIRAKREIELRSADYGFIAEHKSRVDLVDYMSKIAETKNKSNKTLFKSCINYIRKFEKNGVRMTSIDENWLRNFEDFLQSSLSKTAMFFYMNTIRSALNIAVREKLIVISPFVYYRIKARPEQAIKEYLTFEEINLLNNTKCRLDSVKSAFLFACFTRLRISDIINLEWSDVKENHIEFRKRKAE